MVVKQDDGFISFAQIILFFSAFFLQSTLDQWWVGRSNTLSHGAYARLTLRPFCCVGVGGAESRSRPLHWLPWLARSLIIVDNQDGSLHTVQFDTGILARMLWHRQIRYYCLEIRMHQDVKWSVRDFTLLFIVISCCIYGSSPHDILYSNFLAFHALSVKLKSLTLTSDKFICPGFNHKFSYGLVFSQVSVNRHCAVIKL